MLESPHLHSKGMSSWGGRDGGERALPLPVPPCWGGVERMEECRGRCLPLTDHMDRQPRCLSTKFLIKFRAPSLPHWMGGEEDP